MVGRALLARGHPRSISSAQQLGHSWEEEEELLCTLSGAVGHVEAHGSCVLLRMVNPGAVWSPTEGSQGGRKGGRSPSAGALFLRSEEEDDSVFPLEGMLRVAALWCVPPAVRMGGVESPSHVHSKRAALEMFWFLFFHHGQSYCCTDVETIPFLVPSPVSVFPVFANRVLKIQKHFIVLCSASAKSINTKSICSLGQWQRLPGRERSFSGLLVAEETTLGKRTSIFFGNLFL